MNNISVKKVIVLGVPAGNLWDVLKDEEKICRVTYHGNTLKIVKGNLGNVSLNYIEKLINLLYQN